MADRLRGKVALITGAGSGIGAATAGLFAREGATVALTDLAKAGLEPVAADAASAGSQTLVMAGDVTKRTDTERWVDDTLKQRAAEQGLGAKVPLAAVFPRQRVEVVRGPAAEERLQELFLRRGWSDGLRDGCAALQLDGIEIDRDSKELPWGRGDEMGDLAHD